MRRSSGLLAIVLVAGALAGCAGETASEPPAVPRFDTQQVAWAHLRTLHYGDRDFTLPRRIRGLAVSDYGFFVELSDDGTLDGDTTWGYFDGERWIPLGGDPTGRVSVSADGRYAGWIDQDGPRRPAGRTREVVVADVRRGEAVFKDHSGMGGGVGDDLGARYENLAPTFLGFDAGSEHAYWTDASGHGTLKRRPLDGGRAEEVDGDPEVVDAYRGSPTGPPEDQPGHLSLGNGLLSPDRRFAVDVSAPDRTVVVDARTGRRIRVHFRHRAQYFGGWLPGDRLYVIGTSKRVDGYSLTGPDPTRGRVVVCRLPAGTCTEGARVPGLRDVVVPGTQALLG